MSPLNAMQSILASQPSSVFLGAEFTDVGDGTAEITLELKPELRQQHGFAHGGVVSYLAVLPTGATVVCTFGVALALAMMFRRWAVA